MNYSVVFVSAMMLAGCVSSAMKYYTEESIRAGMLPSRGVATVGFALKFDAIPEELEWRIELRMKDESTQKTTSLFAEGKDFVSGKSADKAPVVFSLSSGTYTPEALVFHFPKNENVIYSIEKDLLVVAPGAALKPAEVRSGWMLYIGEVDLGHSGFVPGKASHRTKMSAKWNPSAPALGATWSQVREKVRISDLGFLLVSDAKKEGPVSTRLLFDKTSEAALSALGSGFSDSYGAVLVKTSFPGFAFFDDGAENTHRVQSLASGSHHYFALAVSETDKVTLRGFCFSEKSDVEQCLKETVQEKALWNAEKFVPNEIRFRGSFLRADDKVSMTPILDEGTALDIDRRAPGTEIRSFVLAEEPRKRENLGLVFLDAQGVRENWSRTSQPFVEKIRSKSLECADVLKKTDPFATVSYELFWTFADGKWALREELVKGLDVIGSNVFQECFESGFSAWKELSNTEMAKGFGIRFR